MINDACMLRLHHMNYSIVFVTFTSKVGRSCKPALCEVLRGDCAKLWTQSILNSWKAVRLTRPKNHPSQTFERTEIRLRKSLLQDVKLDLVHGN